MTPQSLRRRVSFFSLQGVVCRCMISLTLLALSIGGLPALGGAQQNCEPDGDVNQSGSVTVADALLTFEHALRLTQLSECQQRIADVFPQPIAPDDTITVADALCIFERALRLPSCLDSIPSPNQRPIANAGTDQSVDAGAVVALMGTASDPDGTIVNYLWEQTGGTAVILSGADAVTATFTAPDVAADETLTFRLTVTDNDGAEASAEVSVTVRRVNLPPVVDVVASQAVDAGAIVILMAPASDSDGMIVNYLWEQTGGTAVILSGADAVTATFTAPDVAADETLTFRLTVTDNDGAQVSGNVSVTVRPVNLPPVVSAEVMTVQQYTAAVADGADLIFLHFDLLGTAIDPDGTIVEYQWAQLGGPTVTLSGANTPAVSFTIRASLGTVRDWDVVYLDEVYSLTFRLTVTDDDGAQASDEVVVTSQPVDNLPPIVYAAVFQYFPEDLDFFVLEEDEYLMLTLSLATFAEDDELIFLIGQAFDPDGTIVGYFWEQTGGTTVSLASTNRRATVFAVPEVSEDETLTFRLTVTDSDGATAQNTVSVAVAGRPPEPGTISGTVIVGEGSVVDSDTMDPFEPVVGNDSLQGQQVALSPPITVAGHVDGQRDEVDVYHVTLAEPTDIILKVGDWPDADLDLYLADASGAIIDGSVGYERFEAIGTGRRPVGEFLVMVRASAGSSNYVLTLRTFDSRRAIPKAYRSGMQLGAEFAPDSIVLEPREDLDETEREALIASLVSDASTARDGIAGLEGFGLERDEVITPSGPVLLEFYDPIAETNALTGRDSIPGEGAVGPLHHATWETAAKARMSRMVKALGTDPDVSYAEPNYVADALLIPNDPIYSRQSHYPQINLPEAWNVTTGEHDVVVAVIDSGVAYHPDLSYRLLPGYDFIRDLDKAGDGDGIDSDPSDPLGFELGAEDVDFHGTHVAGTIGAETNNSLGVAGVTWRGQIMPLRVLGINRKGDNHDISQAILYAAGLPNASGTFPTDGPADIINLSLGPGNKECKSLRPVSEATRDAITKALDAGIHVVIAAGNDGCDVPTPMSLISRVINVGGVDRSGRKVSTSNHGSTIDVVAPGSFVLSTWVDDSDPGAPIYTYDDKTGTSMAAPHVAGVLALMLAINPNLTPEDIGGMIRSPQGRIFCKLGPCPVPTPITTDLGPAGFDQTFGFGLIDARSAVIVAQGTLGRPPGKGNRPRIALNPDSLDFGDSITGLISVVSNVGSGGTIEIGLVATDAPWLTAEFVEMSRGRTREGLRRSQLNVWVDRTGLSPGVYFGNVFLSSNVGDRRVPVTMEVQEPGGNAGTVYILIAEPDSLDPVGQVTTDASRDYEYLTPELPGGSYIVIAGTDRDNDRFICDSGEACGAWRSIDSREAVNVDGDQTGVSIPLALDLITDSGELPLTALFPEGMQSSDIVTNGFRISP